MKFDPYGTQAPPPDLFPEEITDDPWVYFHGTSSVCEESIDASGFDSAYETVSLMDLKSLIGIFRSINWELSTASQQLIWWSLPRIETKEGGRSLFFTNDPELAAQYATKPNAGGEAVSMTLAAIRELRRYLRYPLERMDHMGSQLEVHEHFAVSGIRKPVIEVNLKWLRSQLAGVTELAQRLERIGRSHKYGIVYAVRFVESDIERISSPDSILTYHGKLPRSRIIGKAVVRGGRKGTENPCVRYRVDSQDPEGLIAKWRRHIDSAKVSESPKREDRNSWISRSIPKDLSAGRDLTETMTGMALREYLAAKYPGIVDDTEIFPPLA